MRDRNIMCKFKYSDFLNWVYFSGYYVAKYIEIQMTESYFQRVFIVLWNAAEKCEPENLQQPSLKRVLCESC